MSIAVYLCVENHLGDLHSEMKTYFISKSDISKTTTNPANRIPGFEICSQTMYRVLFGVSNHSQGS